MPHAGSGSTYIYGYCDATYQEGWNKEQTVDFVRNGEHPTKWLKTSFAQVADADRALCCAALALAMSRDGSSGGTIRLAIIDKEGVERIFVPGDKLPKFWDKS